jgi:gamma-glutamyltranspeptidase/glutathione hydrolase
MSLRADGPGWAIATPHTAATDAGVAAFQRGGTAMDAALAAAVTHAVAYPHMCGVGGDLFALVQREDGALVAISSSGRSPTAADPGALEGLPAMPIRGPVPITVPGAVAGWQALHASGARLPWADAFTSATRLAADGVVVSTSLTQSLADPDAPFRDDPGLTEIFYGDGAAAPLGSPVRQPALARTLEAIAHEGPTALYGGAVGRAYAEGLAAAGSPITLDDLATHEASLVAPMRAAFRDLHVSVAPPNSQGFVLLQILALLERQGLDPDMDGPDAGRIARAIDAANADRDRHLADPDRMGVHPSTLLDDGHLAALADQASAAAPGRADGDTIALVAADADGNAVSLIQSLFWGFGSGILEPTTGIVAQNRGACFTLEPGHPNSFAPGVRPFHTLMPVLVHTDEGLAGVAGTMGGYQQPQINLHTITRAFVGGSHPADAVAAPRWVVLGRDEGNERPAVGLEPGVRAATRAALTSHTGFDQLEEDGFGHAHLIRRTAEGFAVGSDPRADGAAAAG